MRRTGALAAGILVAVLSLAAAWPTLHYGFVYDDEAVVVERPPFWEEGLSTFLRSRHWGTGRHATLVSLDLDRLWQGTVPLPFHCTNVALSALLSVLVLAIAQRIGLGLAGAAAAAALFAVHPTHVDAVASIVGRAELLGTLGVLSALLLALRPTATPTGAFRDPETSEPPTATKWHHALAIFLAVTTLAMLAFHAKESSVCLVPLLLLARVLFGSRVAVLPALAGSVLALATLALAATTAADSITRPEFIDNPLAYDTIFERIPKAFAILGDYARLAVWPHPLLPDRSYATTDPGLVEGWIAMAGWGLVAVSVWSLRRRAPQAAFAMAWFPVAFAVTGNVAFPIGTIMAERLLLLPSLAVCLGAGLAVDALVHRDTRFRLPVAAALAVAVAILFTQFRTRAAVWESSQIYFAASAAASPRSAKAAYDHGLHLLREERRDAAEAELARALAIHPAFARASYHLAESMAARGANADGAAVYARYLATTPGDTGALTNITRLLLNAGRPAEAFAWAQRLVEVAPEDPAAIETLVRAEAAVRRADNEAARKTAPVSP